MLRPYGSQLEPGRERPARQMLTQVALHPDHRKRDRVSVGQQQLPGVRLALVRVAAEEGRPWSTVERSRVPRERFLAREHGLADPPPPVGRVNPTEKQVEPGSVHFGPPVEPAVPDDRVVRLDDQALRRIGRSGFVRAGNQTSPSWARISVRTRSIAGRSAGPAYGRIR